MLAMLIVFAVLVQALWSSVCVACRPRQSREKNPPITCSRRAPRDLATVQIQVVQSMEDMLRRQTSNSQDVGTFQEMAKWSRVHLTDRRKTVNVDQTSQPLPIAALADEFLSVENPPKKITSSRNRRQKWSAEYQPKKSAGPSPGADLTGGHSCSGRRGPWEAGPWRPGPRGPSRLNFGLQLQSPDCNLN